MKMFINWIVNMSVLFFITSVMFSASVVPAYLVCPEVMTDKVQGIAWLMLGFTVLISVFLTATGKGFTFLFKLLWDLISGEIGREEQRRRLRALFEYRYSIVRGRRFLRLHKRS